MKYRLADLIDLAEFREMMNSFYEATGIPHGLIDAENNILSGAGWQDVCTKCHRVNPATLARCHESDRYIAKHLPEEPFVGYRCLNGLMDYATPIVVEGEHLATMFVGQLFHEPPDLDFFRAQARQFGFDEEAYINDVLKVPVIPKARIESVMGFYSGLARMLAASGLDRLRQQEAEKKLEALNSNLAKLVQERTTRLAKANKQLCFEIAERKAMEMALRIEKQFSDDTINALPGIFYMFDEQGRFIRWNSRLEDVSGYSNKDIAQMHPLNFFAQDDGVRIANAIQEAFLAGEVFIEADLLTKDGKRIPYYFSGRRIVLSYRPYLLGLGLDITDRVALERKLEFQAHTDPLTSLANRRHFMERAEQELARAQRYGGPLSVLMLDLDRFKAINDTHGHHVGDLVLQTVAEVCLNTLRSVDIVGRIGGEEFAIILPETDLSQALELAERLRLRIGNATVPTSQGETLRFTASIGVASLVSVDEQLDGLLDFADQALYQAKREGRNKVVAFVTEKVTWSAEPEGKSDSPAE